MKLEFGQFSDRGRKPANRDFHGALVPEGRALALKGAVFAVADGISGSDVSAVAAETAVKSLMTDYYATSDAWTVRMAAGKVIAATNAWLHAQDIHRGVGDANRGHVTTLAALILRGRQAHVLHVGDSRVWQVSGEGLEPLTQDHRAVLGPGRSSLARALGAAPGVEIDHRTFDLAVGDVFLLTTDGVHEHMDPRHVVRRIDEADTLDDAALAIVREALRSGSEDNLTVQIVRVAGLADADAASALDAGLDLPVPPLPTAGDRIDGYVILRELARSSRSHVYLAQADSGMTVALKIPATETGSDPAYLRRFALEEWIARRLSSPHVVRAGPEMARSALYVATEYVEGPTLRQWMADTPVPSLQQVRDIVGQIAPGLRAFHRREMIHQDIRPENIVIDPQGTVKIIDLGSASVAGVEEALPGTLGALAGTYQYTAPEYLAGGVSSWRSDQYALGVIAYEMLTGGLPYGAAAGRIGSAAEARRLVYRTAHHPSRPVPGWMDAALARAVHPDPLRRHDALSEFVAALSIPAPGAMVRPPLARRDPVRFWQAVSAGLLTLVVILATRLSQ